MEEYYGFSEASDVKEALEKLGFICKVVPHGIERPYEWNILIRGRKT
jgi:hypothetical protein